MSKRLLIVLFIVLLLLAGGGYFFWHTAPKNNPVNSQPAQATDGVHNTSHDVKVEATTEKQPATAPVNSPQQLVVKPASASGSSASVWNTYANKDLGFSFQYPAAWIKDDKEPQIVNRGGTIIEVDINFNDTVTNTSLLVAYHLPPKGAELYNYAVSQFKAGQGWYASGAKQLMVAGNKAIEANTTINVNGRGTALSKPLKLVVVDFMDNKQKAEFQLQLKTPVQGSEGEIHKLEQLLLSFKFTG